MRSPRTAVLVTAFVFAATPVALAQTTPAPPTEQKPEAAKPITLFPTEARFAFIDFQRVAATSESGKIAARLLKEFGDKKLAELEAQNKQLQALAAKRDTGVVSGPAAAQMARDVARLQREVEFARQNAQAEFQQLRNDVDTDLQMKVVPIVAEIAKERNLHAVFTTEVNLLYVLPALDISGEVVKRLDLQAKKIK
jgi:Skp family chaperone for outer membrane proteins